MRTSSRYLFVSFGLLPLGLALPSCSWFADDSKNLGAGVVGLPGGSAGSGGAGASLPGGSAGTGGNAGTAALAGTGGVGGTSGAPNTAGTAGTGGSNSAGASGTAGTGGSAVAGTSGSGGQPPDGPGVCGDGWRPLESNEQCDDGENQDAHDLCFQCQITDSLGVPYSGAFDFSQRHILGKGRHPLAAGPGGIALVYLQDDAGTASLGMTLYTPSGAFHRFFAGIESGSTVTWDSNPVVAALPDGNFVVAWTDLDGDGDERGIAMRIVLVNDENPLASPIVYANSVTDFTQENPDLLWHDNQLSVCWTDRSDLFSGPDIRLRHFDGALLPQSPELTITPTDLVDDHAVLGSVWGSHAIAWRRAGDVESIVVKTDSEQWAVELALPGPEGDLPSVVELDSTHLLLAYTEGFDPAEQGVVTDSTVMLKVLASGEPEAVASLRVKPKNVGTFSTSEPMLVQVGTGHWLVWREAGALGEPLGDEVYLRELSWDGVDLMFAAAAIALPHHADHQMGDQRTPCAISAPYWPQDALGVCWSDRGGVWTEPPEPIHEQVVVSLLPLPLAGVPQ